MPASHKDLDFSLFQDLIILHLKHFKMNKETIQEKYSFLIKYSLVDYYPKDHHYFVLNEKGKMYLRHKSRDRIRFWLPVFISILALLGGYDVYTNSVLEQFLQAAAKLLKTISGNLGAVF